MSDGRCKDVILGLSCSSGFFFFPRHGKVHSWDTAWETQANRLPSARISLSGKWINIIRGVDDISYLPAHSLAPSWESDNLAVKPPPYLRRHKKRDPAFTWQTHFPPQISHHAVYSWCWGLNSPWSPCHTAGPLSDIVLVIFLIYLCPYSPAIYLSVPLEIAPALKPFKSYPAINSVRQDLLSSATVAWVLWGKPAVFWLDLRPPPQEGTLI